jgi:hypothetical protein
VNDALERAIEETTAAIEQRLAATKPVGGSSHRSDK